MNTIILTENDISKAADLIKNGELVVFPTETVFGLGGNAYDEKAIQKIFDAKGRPSDNPLIVHIASVSDLDHISELSSDQSNIIDQLATAFWPGPLTLIVKRSGRIPDIVTAGLDTIAVRIPSHPIALALIKEAGVPIAAPSANISGKPSGTYVQDILDDFDGKVAAIVESGPASIGIESTVVNIMADPPTLLRPGSISVHDIQKILPTITVPHTGVESTTLSPGTKYPHYSPKARIILFEKSAYHRIESLRLKLEADGQSIRTLASSPSIEFSQLLYHTLRECDRDGIDVILVPAVDEDGIGIAIMNRLRKAASEIIQ